MPYYSPIPGPGHVCSHNLMGGGSVAAASASNIKIRFELFGKTAHAATNPWEGKSALA